MDKNVVITGASSGIGYELVKLFAKDGYSVLAIARTESKLNELKSYSKNISVLSLDLTKDDIAAGIKDQFKGNSISYLINNAGQLINKPFIETSVEDFLQMFSSNVVTTIRTIQAAVPYFSPKGHIVNISSMGGFQGSSKFSGLSAYSAAKGAVSILSECLAEELKEASISINALALGAVQTEMLALAFPNYTAPISPREMAEYVKCFTVSSGKFFNGRILPVTLGDP